MRGARNIAAMMAPFPYFGGKSRAAALVWEALGNVDNFIEPFAGSLAVLLARPPPLPTTETVGDADCWIANFWRATKAAPALVAEHADWPVMGGQRSGREIVEYIQSRRANALTNPAFVKMIEALP